MALAGVRNAFREYRGATDNGDGSVTFVLYCPDWGPVRILGVRVLSRQIEGGSAALQPAGGMEAGHWWAAVTVDPRHRVVEYLYEVQVDVRGEGTYYVEVSDPYSRQVDLNFTSAVTLGEQGFEWTPFERLPMRDLVIYEVHVHDFTASDTSVPPKKRGTYAGLIHRLPYIKSLGFNAIELMPVFDYTEPGLPHTGWNYSTPCHFFAPHQGYAMEHRRARHEFMELVDQCHKHGLAVVVDAVFNQVGRRWSYSRIYDPPRFPRHVRFAQNPFLGVFPGNDDHPGTAPFLAKMWGGYDVDYAKNDAVEFFQDVIRCWFTEYNVDGLRFDYTVGFFIFGRPDVGAAALASFARRIAPDRYLIAEHISSQTNEVRVLRESEFQACWNERFWWNMETVLRGSPNLYELENVIGLERQGYTADKLPVNYVSSHDKERIGRRVKDAWKAQPATILWATSSGALLHWMGDEYGDTGESRDEQGNPIEVSPLNWDAPSLPHVTPLLRRMLWLRRNYQALRGNRTEPLWIYADEDVLVYKRYDLSGEVCIVAVNCGERDVSLAIPTGGVAGTLYEFLTNTEVEADNGRLSQPLRIPSHYGAVVCNVKRWSDGEWSSLGLWPNRNHRAGGILDDAAALLGHPSKIAERRASERRKTPERRQTERRKKT